MKGREQRWFPTKGGEIRVVDLSRGRGLSAHGRQVDSDRLPGWPCQCPRCGRAPRDGAAGLAMFKARVTHMVTHAKTVEQLHVELEWILGSD